MLLRLFAVLLFYVITLGISLPVLPAVALAHGGDGFDVGLLYAIQSLGQFLVAPLWGGLSDRIGRRWAMVIALLGVALIEGSTAFCTSLPLLYGMRFAAGLAGGTVAIGSSFAADVTDRDNRAKGMAVVGISFGLGFTIGPAIGAISASIGGKGMSPFEMGLPFLVAAGCATLAAIFAATLIRDVATRTVSSERRPGWAEIKRLLTIRNLRWLFGFYFVYTFAASIMEGAFFLYMNHQYLYDQTQVGYVFAGLGILTALTQGGIGRAAKKLGERKLASSGGLIVSVTLVIAPFMKPIAAFLATMSFTTVGRALVQPSILSLTSRSSPSEEETGRVMGTLQSASSLGRITGPAIGGWCFRSVAPESPFIVAGVVFFVMAVAWIAIGPKADELG